MIEVKHLTKRYGNHTAVSDLSFEIKKGQIYGFLGPNGAGKSTTMNIMTGCLAATSGEVIVGGHDIFEESEQAKRMIGYLPELPPLYLDRTPREYLGFVARAKKIPGGEIEEQISRVMGVTQITDVSDRLIRNLSKGYRQRVGIAQALLGDPEVIILDEPTVGLDPRQIIEIRDLIQQLGKDHTVILSSHILSEVQAVCQTIMIISRGKLVACDTPENLEKLFAGTASVEVTVEASEEETRKILSGLSDLAVKEIRQTGKKRCEVRLEAKGNSEDKACREIFFAFARAERAILKMTTVKASLEDIFIELTSEEQKARGKENQRRKAGKQKSAKLSFGKRNSEKQTDEFGLDDEFDEELEENIEKESKENFESKEIFDEELKKKLKERLEEKVEEKFEEKFEENEMTEKSENESDGEEKKG